MAVSAGEAILTQPAAQSVVAPGGREDVVPPAAHEGVVALQLAENEPLVVGIRNGLGRLHDAGGGNTHSCDQDTRAAGNDRLIARHSPPDGFAVPVVLEASPEEYVSITTAILSDVDARRVADVDRAVECIQIDIVEVQREAVRQHDFSHSPPLLV